MRPLIKIVFLLMTAIIPLESYAGNPIYTYAGIYMTGGYSKIKYSDWGGTTMNSYSASGSLYSPGVILQIYAPLFIGEFTAGYVLNFTNTAETKINYTEITSKLKYKYALTPSISLTTGPGIYFNTPPSKNHYKTSGGGLWCIGAAFDLGFDWKVSTDIYGSYGSYGIGHDGSRLGGGFTLAVLRKFGKF